VIQGIFINIYYEFKETYLIKLDYFPMTPFYDNMIGDIIKVMYSVIRNANLPEVKSLKYKKSRISYQINALKAKYKQKVRSFIVVDIETIMLDEIHILYAAGYLVVNPGGDLTSIPDYSINTFFSEDHTFFYPKFEERSEKILSDFFLNLEEYVKSNRELCIFKKFPYLMALLL